MSTVPVQPVDDAPVPARRKPGKAALIVGWVLSVPPLLMLGAGGVFAIFNPGPMKEGLASQGFPPDAQWKILTLSLISAALYAIPRTAVLGALGLTAYLGGAVCTHIRSADGMWAPAVVFGLLIWTGLYLREPRLRELLPVRR